MLRAEQLEWMLSHFTERERANAIVGDLLELSERKGRAWLWISYGRVLCSFAWRIPVAWLGAYAIGGMLFISMTIRDPLWKSVTFNVVDPSTPVAAACCWVVVAAATALWFVAPLSLMRFGLRDRLTHLSVSFFVVTTLAVLLSRFEWMLIAGAVVVVATIFSGLFLRKWRRQSITIGVIVIVGVGAQAGTITLAFRVIDLHPYWSYRVDWLVMRLALSVVFFIVIAIYSLLHSLIRRSAISFSGAALTATVFSIAAFAWSCNTDHVFALSDVHPSPYRTNPELQGGMLSGSHYAIRDATMMDLIVAAYGLQPKYVYGGPNWLEVDRFDIVAETSPTTSSDDLQEMLRSLLTDRFKLVTHMESKPLSAFALSVDGGRIKLKRANGYDSPGCRYQPSQTVSGDTVYVMVVCRNITMPAFAQNLDQMAGVGLTKVVVDSTGLKGTWDVDLKWTPKNEFAKSGTLEMSIFEAVKTELGLQLTPTTTPMPVLVIDSVTKAPPSNVSNIANLLPSVPRAEPKPN